MNNTGKLYKSQPISQKQAKQPSSSLHTQIRPIDTLKIHNTQMPYSKYSTNQEDDETTVVTATTTNNSQSDVISAGIQMAASNANSMMQASSSAVSLASQSFCASSEGLPSLAPYINRGTLKHLDSRNLEQNMQIRHDLVMEPGFRIAPQRSESVEDMEAIREEYWSNIRLELAELALPDVHCAPRLCALIAEIRELMHELYPRCDIVTGHLNEVLDEMLIIQQLKHGLLDLSGLFTFLAAAMKKNCAPKRDVKVEAMVQYATEGNVLEALKTCLELMEAMKLDLANYKLDQIRSHVAQSAVMVERKFFQLMLSDGRLTLDLTRKWLSESIDSSKCPSENFIDSLLKLLVCPFVRETSVPETLILDKKRLISMHSAFQDLCIVQCLLLIYKQHTRNSPKSLASERLKADLLELLNKRDTQISDVVDVMARAIAQFRGEFEASSALFNSIHAAINKIIAPENEFFLMVEKKLVDALRQQLTKQTSCGSAGLSDLNVLDKLEELGQRLAKLYTYNWHVFEPVYLKMFESVEPSCKK